MFEAFFTDSCLRYRIEVINGIDFYGLGFGMVRGESMGKWISQWMQKGETASVLITNTKLPDTSGFEFAERIRSQCPRVRVIFVTDTPSFAEAQQAVRFGAYAYLLKSDGIEALQDAMIRVSEELHAESREEAYLCSQRNWDECIPKLLKLLLALKPEIDEDHWQMYSRVKPLLNNASFRMEALLARALMEELRTEIRRRDEALAAQIRSSMMAVPLDTLASAQGTAACIDAIWALLSEKGYITQEDALKSDTIGRACVYMQTHLGEKLTAESVAAYAHISSRHFVRKFRAEMNETFAEYLLRIRIKAAIGMLKNGKDVKSIPEAVGYKDKKSFCTAFKTCTGCSMREYQQRLNLSQREEPPAENRIRSVPHPAHRRVESGGSNRVGTRPCRSHYSKGR